MQPVAIAIASIAIMNIMILFKIDFAIIANVTSAYVMSCLGVRFDDKSPAHFLFFEVNYRNAILVMALRQPA